nr:hypothetical protein B0A51_01078 [Rachicladosporium sp. CCFEE 5018]
MTKTKRPQSSQQDAFAAHFSSTTRYGDRWNASLYSALLAKTRYAALHNRYVPLADFHAAVGSPGSLKRIVLPSATGDIHSDDIQVFVRSNDAENPDAPFTQPSQASNGLSTHWNLDAASALAVHMLHIVPGDRVLDLCAAPGGKSVAIAQSIWPHLQPDYPGPPMAGAKKGALHSNEFDRTRNRRLADNLSQYLPASLVTAGQQKVLQFDGIKGAQAFPLGVGGYDKALVDAPCSSERHIIHAEAKASSGKVGAVADEVARWSPATSKRMAETQQDLLMTALRAVRIGGVVLYATCSISTEENDGVVEKALTELGKKSKKGELTWTAEVVKFDAQVEPGLESFAERTTYGWLVLPDHPNGGRWGPLYFTKLIKATLPPR